MLNSCATCSWPLLLRQLRLPTPSTAAIKAVSAASFHRNMDLQSNCQSSTDPSGKAAAASTVIMWGKAAAEDELAASLKQSASLKLAGEDQLSVSLPSDAVTASIGVLTFRPDLYMDGLSTSRFGRLLLWSPRLPSTQDLVSQNFGDLPIGAVCVADVQFKGRGRSKNVWESPPGCLLFSFTLQMEDGRIVPLLQYVVSLAVTEAIKSACEAKGYPYLDVKLKWPNDIYLHGLKVGGVLCTSTYKSKMFNVTAGIGLNVDNDKPTTCLNEVLKQLNSQAMLRREDLLALFFNKFEYLFDLFMSEGFQALEALYYKTWLHSGQKVNIEERGDGQSTVNVAVTIQGLTSSGYLLAIGEDSKYYELHPDGNSFDFFKGLVRKKVEGK